MTGRATLVVLANLLVLTTAVAELGLSGVERTLFLVLYDLPVMLHLPLLALTPLGSFAAAVTVSAIAVPADRWLALRLLLAGTSAWVVAHMLKSAVARPRPAGLIEDLVARVGAGGLGYPSGHAAVAVALAGALWPDLGGRGRLIVAVVATLVAVARIEQGVHLPLDTVGGVTVGLLAAAIARAAARRRQPAALAH